MNSITTDSTGYSFTYDSYGNPLTVKAGTNLLATYSYGSNNGKLTKVTYGNGFVKPQNLKDAFFSSEALEIHLKTAVEGYFTTLKDLILR